VSVGGLGSSVKGMLACSISCCGRRARTVLVPRG
jgi:hypothetical protein